MSIASVAGSVMLDYEAKLEELLEECADENYGNPGFRHAMKLHLSLLLQVVRNEGHLTEQMKAYLRDIVEE